MISRHLLHSLIATLVILVSGCASRNVDWDYAPSQSLSGLKTYAWIADSGTPELGYDAHAVSRERIHSAVNRQLAARGYRLVELAAKERPAGRVDFLVNSRTELRTRQELRSVSNYLGYYNYPWGGRIGTDIVSRDYQQSTLIIDVVDPATNKLIWSGRSWSRLPVSSTPEQRQQRIDTAVDKILSGFPRPPVKK